MENIKNTELYTRDIIGGISQESMKIIACLWKDPSLYTDIDLTYEDFKDYDNQWATMFYIGLELIKKENKKVISESDITNYLKGHKKCRKVWESIDPDNPYERIMQVIEDIPSVNIDSYIEQRKKLIIIKDLIDRGLVCDEDHIRRYITEMDTEQIYNQYESYLNMIFTKGVMKVKSYNLYDGIEENLLSWNEGSVMGMPFYNLPGFSSYIGGIPLGSVTLLGGVSNSGKSSLLRNSILPMVFADDVEIAHNKELKKENLNADVTIEGKRTVIFLNEEDIGKWQREILTWIFSNKQKLINDKKRNFTKNMFKTKNFYDDTYNKDKINEAIEIMKDLIPENQILFIPLPKFSTNYVIKMIKKYSVIGYTNFIIDTFKMDNTDDAKIDNTVRLQLVQNMTHLYNVAKKDGGKNVRVICTVQLSKAYTLQRYLSQESLAESKNIIDVCSTGIFMRRVWDDEKEGGTKELEVFSYKNSIKLAPLKQEKNYILLFPSKTREGGVEDQCVAEVDWAKNTSIEIGYTRITPNTV